MNHGILHASRIAGGVDLKKAVEEICAEKDIIAGCVVCSVGSLSGANIRLAGAKSAIQLFDELEVLSLSGTVSTAGCHLHISVADRSGVVTGGHLLEGCEVRTTMEIVIMQLENSRFTRVYDASTGFKELRIEE